MTCGSFDAHRSLLLLPRPSLLLLAVFSGLLPILTSRWLKTALLNMPKAGKGGKNFYAGQKAAGCWL